VRIGRFIRLGIGTSALCMAFVGCGGDSSGPTTTDGIYQLRQLNGSALPYDHEGLGCCIYLSGTLDLEPEEGGYAAAITARNRNNSQVFTAMEWGSVIRQGSALTFSPDSAAVEAIILDAGTISGDTIRLAFGGEGPGSPDQFHALYVR
jgi:hypothetical protein